MSATITIKKVLAECTSQERLKLFYSHLHGAHPHRVSRTLCLHELKNCSLSDVLWAVPHSSVGDVMAKRIAVDFAVFCAGEVLHLFEVEHPENDCARSAIGTAERWLGHNVFSAPHAKIQTRIAIQSYDMPTASVPWSASLNAVWAAREAAQCANTTNGRDACARAVRVAWLAGWAHGPGKWCGDNNLFRSYLNVLLRDIT